MLEAQEMLARFTSSDWSHMKQGHREALHRKLHKVAYPVTYSRPVEVQELAKMLGLGRIS